MPVDSLNRRSEDPQPIKVERKMQFSDSCVPLESDECGTRGIRSYVRELQINKLSSAHDQQELSKLVSVIGNGSETTAYARAFITPAGTTMNRPLCRLVDAFLPPLLL